MSDLAKRTSYPALYRTINFLFTVMNLWLIYHLFSLSYSSGFKPPPIEEFVKYRNLFYQIYAIIFILVGIFKIYEIKKADPDFSIFFCKLILSLILTTFSYVIVGLIVDILNPINKLLKF